MLVIHADSLNQKVKHLLANRPATLITIAGVVIVMGSISSLGKGISSITGDGQQAAVAYQSQLKSQVETETGVPHNGRDPASQQQSSLAAAASLPNGTGQRVDRPAAGVTDDSEHAQHTTSVMPKAVEGISAGGCLTDYGIQGQECLPAYMATEGRIVSCDQIHKLFPKGIKVSGTDRYKLDTNNNKLACDAEDEH